MESVSSDTLSQCLQAAAPLFGAAEVRQYDTGRWVLETAEGLGIVIEHDPLADRLGLTAALGEASEGTATELYPRLLRVGANWREEGPRRMALDAVDQTILYLDELPLAGLDAERLAVHLRTFAAEAEELRTSIALAQRPEPEAPLSEPHFTRV